MYTGTNPSALKSREMIVAGMFTLLQTTPYAKITVRKLTDAAEVSRQTFYAIFDNREEVIQCRLQVLFAEYQKELLSLPLTLHNLITLFFKDYARHAETFNLLLDNHLEPLLTEDARQCMLALNLDEVAFPTYTFGFIAAGLTQLLSDWRRQQAVPLAGLVSVTETIFNEATLHD